MEEFVEAMRKVLIDVYIQAYGKESWDRQTSAEKSETLHQLLMAFLNAAKNKYEEG